MKRSHRVLLIVLAAPLLFAAAVALWWSAVATAAARKEHAFYAISENASRTEVVAALGLPDRVRECGKHLWWGDDSGYRDSNDGRCVTEERYEYFLTAFGIGYSAAGRVVSKYRYVSE